MSAVHYQLEFESGGLTDAEEEFLEVRYMTGREELSRLFHFDLVLKKAKGPLTPQQIDDMLKAPCALGLGPGQHDIVHGLLESIELLEVVRDDHATYQARMVPQAYLLTLSRTNRIFQNQTVAQMIEAILGTYNMVAGEHYAMLISGGTTHEYVVQYEESDWAFIQRWLEAEGAYYWFEHTAKGDKIVFADANDDSSPIAEPLDVPYREINNLGAAQDTIWNWTFDQQRIPARVTVIDHNYRTPSVPLLATAPTNEDLGFGTVFRYNEHFKDNAAGEAVAKVRAERVLCERRTFQGQSDCGRLRVGHHFNLSDHFSDDGSYLITAVSHDGRANSALGAGAAVMAYRAKFEAIPMDVQFRPELCTEWPSIHGVLHAHIDSDGDGKVAQIDDQGRYKVRLPFDGSGNAGSSSSRWIRMAQPYSGAGYGQHFPLHKGAEVLLAHIDGDPDRPIIIGAVPCMHTLTPATSANASQSVIQTPTGIRIEMEDQQS